jgi:hypothetical protein
MSLANERFARRAMGALALPARATSHRPFAAASDRAHEDALEFLSSARVMCARLARPLPSLLDAETG